MTREIVIAIAAAIIAAIGTSIMLSARNEEKINALFDKVSDIEKIVSDQVLKNAETICQNRERIAKLEQCK